MSGARWSDPALASQFVDKAYASAKGYVRTQVMHRQLLEHLPPAPARVLDVGAGAGTQSLLLADAGYDVTLLDPSGAMLDRARSRLDALPPEVRDRVRLLHSDGHEADSAVDGQRFDAVLCHGVLSYVDDPAPLLEQLCRCAGPNGVVSIMTGNAATTAVRPAMERRWDDALAAFDSSTEIGVLDVPTRTHTVDQIGDLLRGHDVEPMAWYGVWLFADWLEFAGVEIDPADEHELARMADVEFEAARRDPYRAMSRVFHLIARR